MQLLGDRDIKGGLCGELIDHWLTDCLDQLELLAMIGSGSGGGESRIVGYLEKRDGGPSAVLLSVCMIEILRLTESGTSVSSEEDGQ